MTKKIAPDRTCIVIAGQEFEIKGDMQQAPMWLLKRLKKTVQDYGNFNDLPKEEYVPAMFAAIDVIEGLVPFMVGKDRAAEAVALTDDMTLFEAMDLCGKIMGLVK